MYKSMREYALFTPFAFSGADALRPNIQLWERH
jgi:hypothetical protein